MEPTPLMDQHGRKITLKSVVSVRIEVVEEGDHCFSFIMPGYVSQHKTATSIWVRPAIKKLAEFEAPATERKPTMTWTTKNVTKLVDAKSIHEHLTKANLTAIAYAYFGCSDDAAIMTSMIDDIALYFKGCEADAFWIDTTAAQIKQKLNIMPTRKRGSSSFSSEDEIWDGIFSSSPDLVKELKRRGQSVQSFCKEGDKMIKKAKKSQKKAARVNAKWT